MIQAKELQVGDVIKYDGEYRTIIKFVVPEDEWWKRNSTTIVLDIDGKHEQLTFWNREKVETRYRTR